MPAPPERSRSTPAALQDTGGFRPYSEGGAKDGSPRHQAAGAARDAQHDATQPSEHQQRQQYHQHQQQHQQLLAQLQAQHQHQQQQAAQLQALQAQLAREGQAPLAMGGQSEEQQQHQQRHHQQQQMAAAAILGRLSGGAATTGTTEATGTGLSLGGVGSGAGNPFAKQSGPSVFNPYARPSGGSVGLPGQQPGDGGQAGSAGFAAAAAAQLLAQHQAPYNVRVSPPQPAGGVANPFAAGRFGSAGTLSAALGAAGGSFEGLTLPGGGLSGGGLASIPSGSTGFTTFGSLGGSLGGSLSAGFGGGLGGGGVGGDLHDLGGSPALGRAPTGSSLGQGSGPDLAALLAAAAGVGSPGADAQQALYQQLLEASQAAQARQLLAAVAGGGGSFQQQQQLQQLGSAPPLLQGQQQRLGSDTLAAPSVDAWMAGQRQQSPPANFARRSTGTPGLSRLGSGGAGPGNSPELAGAPEPGSRRPRTTKTRKRKSVSEGSEGGGPEGGRGASGRGRGGGRARDYAALDEKVQRRLAQNREAARKSRQRKKDYMKQLEVELNEKLRRGEIEAAAALASAPELRTGSSSVARPTMSALQQSLRELSSTQSVGAGSSTLTRSLLAQMMPLQQPPAQPTSPFASGGSLEVTAGGSGGAPSTKAAPAATEPSQEQPARSDASPAPLASEASFRFAALPATAMPPVSEALAPLLMPVFGGGAPSDGGSNLRDTPLGSDAVGPPAGEPSGAPSGGAASAMGPGSRTMSVGSQQLCLPGAAATRAQASLNAEVLAAFEQWRAGHFRTALAIRRALDAPAAADDAELRRLVAVAQNDLGSYFQLKQAVLSGESALLVFNGEHLLPAERPYSWLGSLRPSDAVAGLIVKLGDDVTAAALGRLHTLQSSLAEQERIVGSGRADILAGMRQRASTLPASAAGVEAPGSGAGGGGYAGLLAAWGHSEVLGRLDAMRMLMQQPDRLWEQYLTEAGRVLPLRQYAVALISWAETSLQLQSLHLPWLAALHQAAAATTASAAAAAAAVTASPASTPTASPTATVAAAARPPQQQQPPALQPVVRLMSQPESQPAPQKGTQPAPEPQAASGGADGGGSGGSAEQLRPQTAGQQQQSRQPAMSPPSPPKWQRASPARATAAPAAAAGGEVRTSPPPQPELTQAEGAQPIAAEPAGKREGEEAAAPIPPPATSAEEPPPAQK